MHADTLALHDTHAELEQTRSRFNALAQVAGREMPKVLSSGYTVPLTWMTSGIGGAIQARFDRDDRPYGTVFCGLVAAAAYGAGMMAKENADLRNGAYVIANGLGAAAAAVGAHSWVTKKMAATTAPPPAAPAQPQQ